MLLIMCKFSWREAPLSALSGQVQIQLEEGTTPAVPAANKSSACQANRNADVHSPNATQVPFVKSLTLWSAIEAKDVFKEVPQQPLQEHLPALREAMALCLMCLFADLVETIKISSVEDSDKSFEEISTLGMLDS